MRELFNVMPEFVSLVDNGANRKKFKIFKSADYEETSKGALPYHETPKAPEGEDWDFAGIDYTAEQLRVACAWMDSENPDIKSSYKLPHHRPNGTVVWRAVAAAMAALLGARGGVDIPAGDRKAVYNHLARHYGQFDKEVPEFKRDWYEQLAEKFYKEGLGEKIKEMFRKLFRKIDKEFEEGGDTMTDKEKELAEEKAKKEAEEKAKAEKEAREKEEKAKAEEEAKVKAEKETKDKEIADLKARVEVLEKAKGIKKSVTGQDGEPKDKKWPSFSA